MELKKSYERGVVVGYVIFNVVVLEKEKFYEGQKNDWQYVPINMTWCRV